MPDYVYTIKGQGDPVLEGDSGWAWPPLFSGMVTAQDKKAAKIEIEAEYGRKFPLRVLRADLEKYPFLLRIDLLDADNDYVRRRFLQTECKECQCKFKLIDKYNNPHCDYTGADYCSRKCADAGKAKACLDQGMLDEGRLPAVIYQIKQKSTGMVYVGQTIRAYTLRWWQHLTNPSGSKFHKALQASSKTDWEFSVLEVIDVPRTSPNRATYISERERHWIAELDSVASGFNTILPAALEPQTSLYMASEAFQGASVAEPSPSF